MIPKDHSTGWICLNIFMYSVFEMYTEASNKTTIFDYLLACFIHQIFLESYVPGTSLGAGATAIHQTVKINCPRVAYILKMAQSSWQISKWRQSHVGKNNREQQSWEGTWRGYDPGRSHGEGDRVASTWKRWVRMSTLEESMWSTSQSKCKGPKAWYVVTGYAELVLRGSLDINLRGISTQVYLMQWGWVSSPRKLQRRVPTTALQLSNVKRLRSTRQETQRSSPWRGRQARGWNWVKRVLSQGRERSTQAVIKTDEWWDFTTWAFSGHLSKGGILVKCWGVKLDSSGFKREHEEETGV